VSVAAVQITQPDEPFMIGSILYKADEMVAKFVAERIPHMSGESFGERHLVTGILPYASIGVIRKANLVGGVVFSKFTQCQGKMIDVEMSAAFDASDWCRPSTLRAMFSFPFVFFNCIRMTTITGRKNKPARRIDEGLGFKLEGVLRKRFNGREDAMVYGMLREECKWLRKAGA
jgi:RimJ/RimL family protein N-acetyltransferase